MRNHSPPPLDQVGETLRAIGRLHNEHHEDATSPQRWVNRITAIIGQPITIGVLALALLFWITGNLIAQWAGRIAWDPSPFSVLETVATVGALCVTILILVTQRHADELAARRETLILQLAMLSDQKIAKVIQLLQEMRRDDPLIPNREDSQAAEMSKQSDPKEVIETVKDVLSSEH